MKILQLCKKFPYPLKDGESIAVSYLSSALHRLGCEITLLAMNTSKHFFDLDELPTSYDHYKAIHVVEIDNTLKAKDAFLNLFSNDSFHIVRYNQPAYRQKLTELLEAETFDVIQLETLYLAPYVGLIRSKSSALIAMRSHNVEFEIWERIASNTSFGPKKAYLQLLAKRLKRYEIEMLNRYDLMVAITDRDGERFSRLGCTIPLHVTPIGLKLDKYFAQSDVWPTNIDLAFIGSLDWLPNVEGLKWFLEGVWKTIHSEHPEIQFHIAGRNTPDWLLKLDLPGVKVHGEVPDALEFLSGHALSIVPLLSGSGMKVKVLESMALARCTIATSLGLEGIPVEDGKHILVADNPAAFIDQIHFCLNNPDQVKAIGQSGKAFAKAHFDHQEIAGNLHKVYQTQLSSR